MSSTPERRFGIPKKENPIIFGASAIRRLTEEAVTQDLAGVFPKNSQYMGGDYNLIYHELQGYHDAADMLVLTPDGKFQTGRVEHYSGSFYGYWQFKDAKYKPADNLDVVRHAPLLIGELIERVAEEIGDHDNVGDIDKALSFLETKGPALEEEVYAISGIALDEMGEKPQVEEVLEEGDETRQRPPKIERLRTALDLFKTHQDIVAHIRDVAKDGRAREVEKELGLLTKRIVDAGLFRPNRHNKDGKDKWLIPNYIYPGREVDWGLADDIHIHHGNSVRQIAVSRDGEIREFPYGSTKPEPFCAEHVLKEAEYMAEGLIGSAVSTVFPNLVWPDQEVPPGIDPDLAPGKYPTW